MYQLQPLPFLYQDLEPFIDTHTMGLHYQKHQRNYLNQLNLLLEKNHYNYQYPIETLYQHLSLFPASYRNDILFYWGGVVNHDLYFQSINPRNREIPNTTLLKMLEETFGSYEKFKAKFIEYAMSLKGSGYTFLVKKPDGSLTILNTMDQDSPLSYGFVPLLNVDMWEHAYYLNYKNEKMNYLSNFFEIVNFSYANSKC